MRGQRYDLVTESSLNKQLALRKILSYLFSDENIFIDKKFRKLLRNSPRGYVHCDELMNQPMLQEYFDNIEVFQTSQKAAFIRTAVENGCDELYYSLGKVRRVVPFNMEKFKKMKPICIERITSPITIQDIRDVFDQHVFALNQKIQKQNLKDNILIFSQHYRERLAVIKAKNPPFSIMDYDQFAKEYDLDDRMRQRKLRNIERPMQMPKKRIEDEYDDENYFHGGKEERHERIKKSHMRSMKNNFKQEQREFVAIGREPNEGFNQLLTPLLQSEAMRGQ